MLNNLSIIFVCLALGFSVFITFFSLFRSQSPKRHFFLLMQASVIISLTGYLLVLMSASEGEAFTAVRVIYLGAMLVAVFTFFFAADYCDIKLHSVFVQAPVIILAVINILAVWTTNIHHMVYINYWFETSPIRSMAYELGPMFPIVHGFMAVCFLMALIVLLIQINKWKSRYRRQFVFLLVCIAVPFVFEVVYLLTVNTGVFKFQIYLTPYSTAIISFCLYSGLMRFNNFEIIPRAAITALEHIREGYLLVDDSNNYLASNQAAAKIFPDIVFIAKGGSISSIKDWPVELNKKERLSVEFSINNDGLRFFRASVSPVFGKNQTLVARIILFGEITDSVNLMRELQNAAYIDSLTGLYNRKHFSELANVDIERALRLNQSIYTAMLDLDFFKNINDTYGHAAGDLVLKSVAGVIRQTLRSYDLIGRYGGEEFVLLITDLDTNESFNLMERIRKNMENNAVTYEDIKLSVTCSIGLAEFKEGDALETSIKKADDALYKAKHSGRNCVVRHNE